MVPRPERGPHTCKSHDNSMVNKKGYLKTLEAVIAVIMVVIVSYTLIPRPTQVSPDVPLIVKGAQTLIDQSIQFNDTIRKSITGLHDPAILSEGIQAIIDKHIPPGYAYTCAICSNPGKCLACTPLDKSIYMTDIIIGSSDTQQNPKIVRIWFWKEPTTNWPQYNHWYKQCNTDIPCVTGEEVPCKCQCGTPLCP